MKRISSGVGIIGARASLAAFCILGSSWAAWGQFILPLGTPPPFPVPVGNGPVWVVSGDFNSDTVPDLAVLNQGDGTVTLILSNGTAGYTITPQAASGLNHPRAMEVGDFNNDGKLDLAVANTLDNNIVVLLGDGKGGLKAQTPVTVTGGTAPVAIVKGNFISGDSNLDLAVAYQVSNNVIVLKNDGVGGFTPVGTAVTVGNKPSSLTAGDFNSDGKLDLAVTNELDNTVTVLPGNGAAGFATAAAKTFLVGFGPVSVAAADFNLDGNLDLAIANLQSQNLTLLLGNGAGQFTPSPSSPVSSGAAPIFLAVADFNGDSIPDLAVANYSAGTVTVLLGDGTGGFKPAQASPYLIEPSAVMTKGQPVAIAVGDFNGDGAPDLAVVDSANRALSVLYNQVVVAPTLVNGASLSPATAIAPGSLATIFGTGFGGMLGQCQAQAAQALTVSLKDASGAKSKLILSCADPTQINGMTAPVSPAMANNPPLAPGPANFTVTTSLGLQTGTFTAAVVAPGLFSANSSGKGVASAKFIQDILAGTPPTDVFYTCTTPPPPQVPVCPARALDVTTGNPVLELYGTGIRNRVRLSDVTVTVNGQSLPAFLAQAADTVAAGVDEVWVPLPSSLAHSGTVFVSVSVAGTVSNQVTLYFN